MRITPSTLEKLISRDYTIDSNGGRWARTREHDSLVIDRENGKFFWNKTGKHGNALDWLIKVKGYSYPQSIDILESLNYEYPISTQIKKEPDIVVPELVESFWNTGKYQRGYWYKRGLRDTTIDAYQLGYYNSWFTLPVFIDQKLRNFQLRREEPTKEIRYYYRGIGPTLVNADILNFIDWVVITEGTIDAVLLMQEGIPAVSHTGGANGWNYNWYKYFKRVKKIYYIADNDYAGIQGATRVARMDQNRIKIFQFDTRKEKYDTVDYFRDGGSAEELKKMLPCQSKYLFQM